jgi:hypothetical protein
MSLMVTRDVVLFFLELDPSTRTRLLLSIRGVETLVLWSNHIVSEPSDLPFLLLGSPSIRGVETLVLWLNRIVSEPSDLPFVLLGSAKPELS